MPPELLDALGFLTDLVVLVGLAFLTVVVGATTLVFLAALVVAAALGFLTALAAAAALGFLTALVALAIFGVLAVRAMVIFPYGKGNLTMSTVLQGGLPRGAQINGCRNYQITAVPATISLCFFELATTPNQQLLS